MSSDYVDFEELKTPLTKEAYEAFCAKNNNLQNDPLVDENGKEIDEFELVLSGQKIYDEGK
ncbi:MAG: hypothetical protein FWE57_08460 [Chitinispirillia bacterium]|nr:hypothetical protein [Chitinispirillia bacterium]